MSARREPMSGVDTAWLHMDRPANLMQILGVIGLRGHVGIEALRERIEASFLLHSRFRMRPVDSALGASWEAAEDFDLRAHVREVTLRRGAGEAGLRRLLGELASTPLDPRRPRWEFVLVQAAPQRSVLAVRIHHCYADGIALVRVVLGLVDGAAVLLPADREPQAARDTHETPPVEGAEAFASLAPELLARLWRESQPWLARGLHLATHPAEAGEVARAGLGMAGELAHLALLPDEAPTPLRGTLSGDKRLAWARPFPFETVRAAARALGCTINDLLVAAATTALAAWLREQGAPPGAAAALRAIVPVNLRPPQETGSLGNRFGLVFLDLPVGRRDARSRLAAVRERMQALKSSSQPPTTLALLAAFGFAPRALQTGAVDLLSRKATLVLSNVPGPREPLRLLGVQADSVMFWVPQSGDLGLGVSVLTCGGEVRFGVMADAALVAEPLEIAARFPVALRRYAALAGIAAVSARRAAPRARR